MMMRVLIKMIQKLLHNAKHVKKEINKDLKPVAMHPKNGGIGAFQKMKKEIDFFLIYKT